MNTKDSSPASLAAAHGSALLTRLYNHRAMMAPHQKERHTGKLLLECIAEIERLNEAIRLTLEENCHLADGDNCTLLRLKRAYAQNEKLCRPAGDADGSKAAPGFMKPEGIVCFHVAANSGFKKTLEKDEAPKSQQALNNKTKTTP